MSTTPEFREVTDIAALTPLARQLVLQAFAERLGSVAPTLDFHRGWNGGWRCRAALSARAQLDFVLLRTPSDALLAFPLPMPSGWSGRGVADSDGARWTADADGQPIRVTDG